MPIFVELGLILVVAMLVSVAARLLRQPLIIGYILTGILVGPYFFNILRSGEELELLAKIGIAILLFIVGLALSPHVVREVGKISVITGIGQILFTSLIGFVICLQLGFGLVESLFVALALTFSSTIIVLKLLSDKNALGTLFGKISIGFLLVQDIAASLILLAIPIFAASAGSPSFGGELLFTLGKGIAAIVLLYMLTRYLVSRLSGFLASSQELLFVFSLSWGLGIAALFYAIGFSIEIGALAAGVSLSLFPFAHEIAARMRPLRDFFLLIFFILLGSRLAIGGIEMLLFPALALSLFVLVGNPLIVYILMNHLGFGRRTSFFAGLTVAQISEFSLILVLLGSSLGYLSDAIVSLVTLVGLVTIAASTYLILYAERIYPHVEWLLKFVEFREPEPRQDDHAEQNDILIFGYDRVGSDFVNAAKKLGRSFLVVDFNPHSIKRLAAKGIPHRYGDAEDPEFLAELNLPRVELIVSAIPHVETNAFIIRTVRAHNPDTVIIVMSHDLEEAEKLYELGATYVVMPYFLGASNAASLIEAYGSDPGEYEEERARHRAYLKLRKAG